MTTDAAAWWAEPGSSDWETAAEEIINAHFDPDLRALFAFPAAVWCGFSIGDTRGGK